MNTEKPINNKNSSIQSDVDLDSLASINNPEVVQNSVPIPTYNPNAQFTIEDLEEVYPEWQSHGLDEELVAILYEHTEARRNIRRKTGGIDIRYASEGLEWAIKNTPTAVGSEFNAHGIGMKVKAPAQILDGILKLGVKSTESRMFYTMPFRDVGLAAEGFGAQWPFTDGGFILLSGPGEKIEKDGVKFVVVGEAYMRVMDILKKRYPEVTFIPWNEAPKMLTDMVNEADSKEIPLNIPEETVCYRPIQPIFQPHEIQEEPIGDDNAMSVEGLEEGDVY